MLRKRKWAKIIISVCLLLFMGGYTFSDIVFAHGSEMISNGQTKPQLLSAKAESTPKESGKIKMVVSPRAAAAGQGEILYDLTYSGSGIWRFADVDVGSPSSGTGYKTIDISYPAELKLNYTAPIGWTFSAPHTESGTTSLHIIVTDPNTQAKPEQITAFLTEASTYLTLIKAGEYPPEGSNVIIDLSKEEIIHFVDAEGKGHYYEFIFGNMTWQKAYNAAKSRSYNGLNGYLATLTSLEEQDYVYSNIGKQAGWLGGTRARFSDGTKLNNETSISENIADYTVNTSVSPDWYWASGPEADMVFFGKATYSEIDGTVDGVFNFFSNQTTYNRYPSHQSQINTNDEPNNAGDEAYLQFAYNRKGSWNDLEYNAPEPQGYYVEYTAAVTGSENTSGGARIPLSATITTTVNTAKGGTVLPGGTWTYGSSHTLTATPNDGWKFTGWEIVSGDGTLSTTTDPNTIFTVADGPATIRATFEYVGNTESSSKSKGNTDGNPGDNEDRKGETTDPSVPQTGDDNSMSSWVLLLTSSLAIMLTIIIGRRKEKW